MSSKSKSKKFIQKRALKLIAIGLPKHSDRHMYSVVRFLNIDGKEVNLPIPATTALVPSALKHLLTEHRFCVPRDKDQWDAIQEEIARDTDVRVEVVMTPGFAGRDYLLPDGTKIGTHHNPGPFLVIDNGLTMPVCKTNGDLTHWQTTVACHAEYSSRLMLAFCAALSGPLLRWAGLESGGFHFHGTSSHGKSTCLTAAVSVIGPPEGKHSWSVTEAGVEELAAGHSDSLLALDEIRNLDEDPRKAAQKASKIGYKIAEGKPKVRSRKYLTKALPESLHWNVSLLSTGEQSLEEHAYQGGATRMLGEEVRVVDVPADAGTGYGIFEFLPDDISESLPLLDKIRAASARAYGTPQRHFLAHLTDALHASRKHLKRRIRKFMREFSSQHAQAQSGGAQERYAKRFALAYAAGALAAEWDVLPFGKDVVLAGVSKCFKDALSSRPQTPSDFVPKLIANIHRRADNGKFLDIRDANHSHSQADLESARGYITTIKGRKVIAVRSKTLEKLIPEEDFRKAVVAELRRAGLLLVDKDEKSTRRPTSKLAGCRLERCYCFVKD